MCVTKVYVVDRYFKIQSYRISTNSIIQLNTQNNKYTNSQTPGIEIFVIRMCVRENNQAAPPSFEQKMLMQMSWCEYIDTNSVHSSG